MEIRPARPDDVPAVVALAGGLFAEDGRLRDPYLDLDWPAREGTRYYGAVLRTPHAACWVAAEGGGVVGYLVARLVGPYPSRPVLVAELENIFVEPGRRGRGLGGRLLAEFVRWADGEGAARMSVTAYAANERAIAFYRRHGFAPRSLILESAPGDLR